MTLYWKMKNIELFLARSEFVIKELETKCSGIREYGFCAAA